jgi:hypothetical protein
MKAGDDDAWVVLKTGNSQSEAGIHSVGLQVRSHALQRSDFVGTLRAADDRAPLELNHCEFFVYQTSSLLRLLRRRCLQQMGSMPRT